MEGMNVTEHKTPELSDDWHLDEPLAYLVKCYDTTISEYQVFACEIEAQRFAEQQEEAADDEGDEEVADWLVYPLYAGHGRHLSERRFS
jgi:hypothetical protein